MPHQRMIVNTCMYTGTVARGAVLGSIVPHSIGVLARLAVVEAQLLETLGEDVFARRHLAHSLLACLPDCLFVRSRRERKTARESQLQHARF